MRRRRCMNAGVHVPWHAWGGQETTPRSRFSSSTMGPEWLIILLWINYKFINEISNIKPTLNSRNITIFIISMPFWCIVMHCMDPNCQQFDLGLRFVLLLLSSQTDWGTLYSSFITSVKFWNYDCFTVNNWAVCSILFCGLKDFDVVNILSYIRIWGRGGRKSVRSRGRGMEDTKTRPSKST